MYSISESLLPESRNPSLLLEIRLVRCPKCNKVLPEPPVFAVYQCGACGALLRVAKRLTLTDGLSEGSEELVNSAKEGDGEEGVGGSKAGTSDQEGAFYMASRSPARSTIGEDIVVQPPVMERALTEFDGGLPKSPIRDRFLNDLGSVPSARMRSRDVSRSPMRERGIGDSHYDRVGKSPARKRNFSNSPMRDSKTLGGPPIGEYAGFKSPMRESDLTELNDGFPKSPMRDRFLSDLSSVPNSPMRFTDVSRSPVRETAQGDFDFDGMCKSPVRQRNGSQSPIREIKTPISVRSRNVSRSPMREGKNDAGLECVDKSPARSMAGDFPKSPMRRAIVSEFDEAADVEQEEAEVSISAADREDRGRKVTVKSSFNAWLTDNEQTEQSDDNNSGRRRAWRDQVGFGVDQVREARESVCGYEDEMASEGSIDDRVYTIDPRKKSLYRDRLTGEDGGYVTSRASMDQSAIRRDRVGLIRGNLKAVVEQGSASVSSSSSAGQASNYCCTSIGSYSEPRHSFEHLRGPASFQHLEMERAELLRRYKELSEQLGDLDDKRISSTGSYNGPDGYSEDEFRRFKARSGQQFVPGRGVRRCVHVNHPSSPLCNMADVYDVQPPPYDHPFSSQMTREPRLKQAHQHSKYIPGSVGRFDQDTPKSYLDEAHYHHPSCSCSLCYTDDLHGQDLPYYLAGRRSANLVGNPRPSHSMDLDRYGRQVYNLRMAHTTPLERPSHLTPRLPRRGPQAGNKQICLPIGGGAPFILCRSCFQLLKLPRKLMLKQKNQCQLQCGACSAVMSFGLQCKSFSLFSAKKSHDFTDASGDLVKGLKESSLEDHRDSCDATRINVGSCDFDALGNSFQSMDSEASAVSKEQRLNSSLAGNTQQLSTSSSHSSEEDRVSDNASVRSSLSNSTEMPLKTNLVPPPPGSPLRDLLDYSLHFRRIQAGEITSGTEEEKQVIAKDTSLDSPVGNTEVATEMEVHPHEVPTPRFSIGSEDVPRRENGVGFSKDGPSSITGSMSPGRTEVHVNGRHIPLHLVKKAEKYAGPVQPGEYWYDSKAGFWGEMGHRCLGIIPPFIQEFSFPMPANCSGGNTTIYVNGRELNKKDLDILEGRRLPATRNKRYIIDISGKVLDEGTKKFVVNLGKLAPTVERKRRGFGMQVPEDLDNE